MPSSSKVPTPVQSRELASRFQELLCTHLGVAKFNAVLDRNRSEPNSSICHSHDFCDANEIMAEAFALVRGRPVDTQSNPDIYAWNVAWSIFRHPEPATKVVLQIA